MSEKIQIENFDATPPSPEQQQAFRLIYSNLMRVTAGHGMSKMITRDNGYGFVNVDREYIEGKGEEFNENSKYCPISYEDQSKEVKSGWLATMNESAVREFGKLGFIDLYRSGGSHPADVYVLYPDYSIRHYERLEESDGYFEDGDPINWREKINDLGLIDVEEMQELSRITETFESRI